MATIRSTIELFDAFSAPLERIMSAVDSCVSSTDRMQAAMNANIDTSPLQSVEAQINGATSAAQEFDAALQNVSLPPELWQSASMPIFTNTGIERFQSEVQSANSMMNTLNATQNKITAAAAGAKIFPQNMLSDLGGMASRLQAIQARIEQIENNPVNLGTDIANSELEQLRGQLHQAVSEQEALNHAVDRFDIQGANAAYLRLSNIIDGTERHIRDNVDEQGRFNRAIQQGTESASSLKKMIAGAVGGFLALAGVTSVFGFMQSSLNAFDAQLSAETQLVSVLTNTLDTGYETQFEIQATADTTAAVDEINAITDHVSPVTVSVEAQTQALHKAFDEITAKAAEIQSRGIYGDEAMIAAGAEFSTYFSDVNATLKMMDTLSNYAAGMSGGGAIDQKAMVDYATNLGKIMTGSYDAMTKKGFEFTDAQKAIIEGEASREQIIATLGEEYADMSKDMQAAAAISQVIDASWAGLYESMSNTPEGKIIQLNNAWGDMQEVVGKRLYPYVILFVDAIANNWGLIESVIGGITTALQVMLGLISWGVNAAISFAKAVADNWGFLAPIVYGLAAAMLVYVAAVSAYNTIQAITTAVTMAGAFADEVRAAASMMATGATIAETAAQHGLNAALLACPITWIVLLVIGLVAALYAAVAAVNRFAGTSISATGIICAAFMVMYATIRNGVIVPLWNGFAMLANFIGNVFNSPIAAVEVAFYDMCLTVIGYIQNLASAIETLLNKIPGVTVDITSGLDNFYNGLAQAQQAVKDESGWVEYVGKMDYTDLGDAAAQGYEFGEGVADAVENFDPNSLFGVSEIPSAADYAAAMAGDAGLGDDLGGDVGDVAGNTGNIANELSDTEENLKYLRDVAEQEAINRFTTAEIKVDMSGMQNTVNSNMDLDGMVSYLTDTLTEQMSVVAEGVHT